MVGLDHEKESVKGELGKLDVQEQNMGFLSPTTTQQSQRGNRPHEGIEDEGDDIVIVMPGSLSSSSSSASVISLPRVQRQAISATSFGENTVISPLLSDSRGVPSPSSSDYNLEQESPTATAMTVIEDARFATTPFLGTEGPSLISRSSSVSQSSASSSSGISLSTNDIRTPLSGLPKSARLPWPTLVEDGFSTSSIGSSGGSSTVSLADRSSATESTVTTTAYPPRYSAQEKGKGRAVDQEPKGDQDNNPMTDVTNNSQIKLKSIMKKTRKRHRRVSADIDACTKHRVIQEDGISRDFLLLVTLCIGFACAGILVVRPALSKALGRNEYNDVFGAGLGLFED
ncbi:hypothetical protein JR316_0010243 [Psilocybe cubensis]|uniref:Uncharacterized protein n=2 Tax=Psilocybe cubensis TaxID=181762 RepID=A0ACB8GSK4_PSICU|nr:hypothetical protein JR316_0010243 [Psilocybe cubensis]KAH9478009.1 hypothetical protein JR316_0010243 [Psilocybe cubensis]